MVISFVTPTYLSPLDLTVLGGSDKRGNPNMIGQFSTGFKYAIALCLRNNITMTIVVKKDDIRTEYTISSKTLNCDSTNKSKEVIVINEYSNGNDKEHITGYSVDLGFDWNLDKVFTELYSNMLDESGQYYEEDVPVVDEGTYIYLQFDDNCEFADIVNNKDNYVLNNSNKLFSLSDTIDVIANPDNFLIIYKNGILVYKNEKEVSRYAYNIKFGDLDERRILKSTYSVGHSVYEAILNCNNIEILPYFIQSDNFLDKNDWLNTLDSSWYSPSQTVVDYVYNIFREHGEVYSLHYLLKKIEERGDCILGERKIDTIQNSLYSYTKTVTVIGEVLPEVVTLTKLSLKEQIEAKYNIKIDCDIKIADINGTNVIADKFNNCLLLNEHFDIDNDITEFIIQYYQLTSTENIIKVLAKEIVKLIKK